MHCRVQDLPGGPLSIELERSRIILLLLIALACLSPHLRSGAGDLHLSAAAAASSSQSTTKIFTSTSYAGTERSFLLHVPPGLVQPAPLLVALHGLNQTADDLRRYSELEDLAQRRGLVLAFASGIRGSWNAGSCCGFAAAQEVDDLTYLSEVVAAVRARTWIDERRIGVTGFSNGAMMALRFACERSDLISSAAVVAGGLLTSCSPSRGVAVLEVHGEKDNVVPGLGGYRFRTTLPPVRAGLEPFRRAGGPVGVRVVPEAGHGWHDSSEHVGAWLDEHPRD